MNILEVLALLGFGLGCIKFGYELGKNAKNNRPAPILAVILTVNFEGQPSIGSTLSVFIILYEAFAGKKSSRNVFLTCQSSYCKIKLV